MKVSGFQTPTPTNNCEILSINNTLFKTPKHLEGVSDLPETVIGFFQTKHVQNISQTGFGQEQFLEAQSLENRVNRATSFWTFGWNLPAQWSTCHPLPVVLNFKGLLTTAFLKCIYSYLYRMMFLGSVWFPWFIGTDGKESDETRSIYYIFLTLSYPSSCPLFTLAKWKGSAGREIGWYLVMGDTWTFGCKANKHETSVTWAFFSRYVGKPTQAVAKPLQMVGTISPYKTNN